MPVPVSVEHRVRMLIWGWAVAGYGVEDIELKLRQVGETAPREFIWEIVMQAQRRARK